MEELLRNKLRTYIAVNNPDLIVQQQYNRFSFTLYVIDQVQAVMPKVMDWLESGVPQYEIEELALKEMTATLRPSKYQYIKQVLEEDFPLEEENFTEAGVLTFEIINMIELCQNSFEAFDFSEETQHERKLRYAIIADIASYLNS